MFTSWLSPRPPDPEVDAKCCHLAQLYANLCSSTSPVFSLNTVLPFMLPLLLFLFQSREWNEGAMGTIRWTEMGDPHQSGP